MCNAMFFFYFVVGTFKLNTLYCLNKFKLGSKIRINYHQQQILTNTRYTYNCNRYCSHSFLEYYCRFFFIVFVPCPSDPIKLYDLQQKPDLLIQKQGERLEGERKSLNCGEIGNSSRDIASRECIYIYIILYSFM